jgi:hypothetical protein
MRMGVTAWVFALLAATVGARAQSSTPQGALEEMATTDDVEVVLRHLPVAATELLKKLPPRSKAEAFSHLLTNRNLKEEGLRLRRSVDGAGWEVVKIDTDEIDRSLQITDDFVSGDRALLTIRSAQGGEAAEVNDIAVLMRLEQGEWRLSEFGRLERQNIADYMSERFDHAARNESVAVETLQFVIHSLKQYATNYPAIGYPEQLMALACTDGEPTAEHACVAHLYLISGLTSTTPWNGYTFQYSRGGNGAFHITATPSEWAETGAKSFFVDESGDIRFTSENRVANQHDEIVTAQDVATRITDDADE